jgi:hypothetical protein
VKKGRRRLGLGVRDPKKQFILMNSRGKFEHQRHKYSKVIKYNKVIKNMRGAIVKV